MKSQYHFWFRSTVLLLLVILVSFNFALPTNAQSIITQGTIPAGTVVENDILIFGKAVVIDGTVNGDVFAFGNSVIINGDVSGSVLTGGRDIQINNSVSGSLYAVGANLDLGSSASIGRSVYYGGLSLTTDSGSSIGRDLVVLSLGAQLSGQVGRDSRAIIGLLEIIDVIRLRIQNQTFPITTSTIDNNPDDTTIPENQLELDPTPTGKTETSISEKSVSIHQVENSRLDKQQLVSFHPADIDLTSGSSLSNKDQFIQNGTTMSLDTERILAWLKDRFSLFVTYWLLGLLIVWLLPQYLNTWSAKLKTEPLLSCGYGLLGLVVAINGFVIAAVIAAVILAAGIGLGYITLWNLAFYFMGISFACLVLALFLFALFVFYISKIIVAYLLGALILQRYTPRYAENKMLSLTLGLIIFTLIASLPYIGWALGVAAIIIGLGAVWLAWRDKTKETNQPDTPSAKNS